MDNDVLLTLLSGAPSVPGLVILHCAFRAQAFDRRGMGSWKGIALLLVGLLLIATPLVVWSGFVLHQHQNDGRHASAMSVLLLAGYLDVIFFWFLWNVASFVFGESVPGRNVWEENWGASYSPELKRRLLGKLLDDLDREGKIGNLILDIGSGADPVSKLLPSSPDRKFVYVDIAGGNSCTLGAQSIRFDVEQITRPESISYRRALLRVCRFVGGDPGAPMGEGQATTILFSDILNYVDFRKVVGCFADFLKPDGRIIIVNFPGRGVREEFSENGLKKNEDLYQFLEGQNFAIERKEFPCRPEGATEESEEMIVLVARRAGQPARQMERVCLRHASV
ncbi:MAG: hypothetical protein P4L99_06625 [Chthoniobacter sp.]|nr:hypothetical protein [Chthoniobacter sp.]